MSRRLLLIVVCALCAACKTYDQYLEPVQRAYYDNSPEEAVTLLETYLEGGMSGPGEYDFELLKLELASALQAAGRYKRASTVLEEVDGTLEVLDYSNTSAQDIANFLFAAKNPWRATPPERLLVNSQGMVNRLAQDQNPDRYQEAAVEARRLGILLEAGQFSEDELFANRFASGMAGFCFEANGNRGEAEEAWSLLDGANPFARGEAVGAADGAAAGSGETGSVLVVVQMGKAPIRREFRVSLFVDAKLYTLRMPVIVDRPDTYSSARVLVDGVDHGPLENVFDLGRHLEAQYERDRAKLLAAAATQLVSRAVMARSVREVSQGGEKNDDFAGFFVEFLASLFLAELQPPDTRCWSLVPQAFHVKRLELPPGQHTIEVALDGRQRRRKTYTVDVAPRQPRLVNVVSDCYRTWSEKEEKRLDAYAEPTPEEVAEWEGIDEAEAEIRRAVGGS